MICGNTIYALGIGKSADLLTANHMKSSESLDNEDGPVISKCGFAANLRAKIIEMKHNTGQLNKEIQSSTRPVSDTSVVSASGYFRVHYNTISGGVPKYSVSALCDALDSAYNYEVNYLGYPPPPSDGIIGGDNKYDVYLTLLSMEYGSTIPENEVTPGSSTFLSYLKINSDFTGYPTKGIAAAMVTAAHEFHHAIQLGNYPVRFDNDNFVDLFFYEMTSTTMEEFVFPEINDYVFYCKSFFSSCDQSLFSHDGYDIAVWNIFLTKKYDAEIIKRQWELLKTYKAIEAINQSIIHYGSTFNDVFSEFANELFYTNYRASSERKYFKDASLYPSLKPLTAQLTSRTLRLDMQSHPAALNLISIYNNQGTLDSLAFIVSNGDIKNSISQPSVYYPYSISISLDSLKDVSRVAGRYFLSYSFPPSAVWQSKVMLNNADVSPNINYFSDELSPYPSPFVIGNLKTPHISIPLKPNDTDTEVEFHLYTSAMNEIYSSRVNTYFTVRNCVRLNPLTDFGTKPLASGVYIYCISSRLNKAFGKFVIVNK